THSPPRCAAIAIHLRIKKHLSHGDPPQRLADWRRGWEDNNLDGCLTASNRVLFNSTSCFWEESEWDLTPQKKPVNWSFRSTIRSANACTTCRFVPPRRARSLKQSQASLLGCCTSYRRFLLITTVRVVDPIRRQPPTR